MHYVTTKTFPYRHTNSKDIIESSVPFTSSFPISRVGNPYGEVSATLTIDPEDRAANAKQREAMEERRRRGLDPQSERLKLQQQYMNGH